MKRGGIPDWEFRNGSSLRISRPDPAPEPMQMRYYYGGSYAVPIVLDLHKKDCNNYPIQTGKVWGCRYWRKLEFKRENRWKTPSAASNARYKRKTLLKR